MLGNTKLERNFQESRLPAKKFSFEFSRNSDLPFCVNGHKPRLFCLHNKFCVVEKDRKNSILAHSQNVFQHALP